MENCTIHTGDALEVLQTLPDKSIQCCVTSPPYWGLRDYGVDGQIGLEQTPEAYVNRLVEVFREVRRVLRNDGTLWLNLGDSYASGQGGKQGQTTIMGGRAVLSAKKRAPIPDSLKPKDLVGIPWMVAFALRADGWYLRSDIIWSKPNAMPESVRDRPTKAHEYLFLITKSEKYYYDHEAIKEPAVSKRSSGNGYKRPERVTHNNMGERAQEKPWELQSSRQRRSVWTVNTKPFKGAHFAVFPPALIEPCILAGSKRGDIILDPFNGAATTGIVALQHGRNYIGIELSHEYVEMSKKRIRESCYEP